MQKTGTIAQLVPDGGYQSQNGYINTFQMTIQCPDGTFTGQIGSKTAIYPLIIGQEISVEITDTEHGVRFKKFNPQYAQGGSQGSQRPNADPNKELYIKREVAIKAVLGSPMIPNDQVGVYLLAVMAWIETGKWQVLPSNAQNPPPTEDDIPFSGSPDYDRHSDWGDRDTE